MSTNKTQNYNLHSWVPEDDFIRSEFNDNFTGIDAALKTLSDGIAAETSARTSAVAAEKTAREQAVAAEKTAREQAVAAEKTAREQAVAAEATARAAAVTAEQNARAAAINSLTAAKAELVMGSFSGDDTEAHFINLGFPPKAVLIVRQDGCMGQSYSLGGGLVMPGKPVNMSGSSAIGIQITGNGFTVYKSSSVNVNSKSFTYYYIAFK